MGFGLIWSLSRGSGSFTDGGIDGWERRGVVGCCGSELACWEEGVLFDAQFKLIISEYTIVLYTSPPRDKEQLSTPPPTTLR